MCSPCSQPPNLKLLYISILTPNVITKNEKRQIKTKAFGGQPSCAGLVLPPGGRGQGMCQYPFATSFLLGLILSSSSLFCYSELSKSYFKQSLFHYVLTYFFLSLLILPSFLNLVTLQHLLLLPFLLSTLLLFLS